MQPTQIDKYVLGRKVGQGGMGAVYESFHPQLGIPVAVKLVRPTADAAARASFFSEARAVARLSHPGVVNLFDFDEHQGQPYLVMELAPGSLADALAAGPLPIAAALRLASELASALAYAHGQGVVHGDIKPANVLLRADGSAALADFGLAHAGGRLARQLGTPAYAAPEQIRGRADARADLYSLGAVLFEALAGRPPFLGSDAEVIRAHHSDPPPDLLALRPDAPPALASLALRLLAKDPDQRPASAAEVAQSLRLIDPGAAGAPTPASGGAPVPPPPATGPTIALGRGRRRWAGPAFALAAALALLAFAAAGLRGAGGPLAPPTAPAATATRRPLTPLALRQLGEAPMEGATPAAGGFAVAGVTWVKSATSVQLYGDVAYREGQAPAAVRVRVTLRDAAGRAVATAENDVERRVVRPGERAPFSVLFYGETMPKVGFEGYDVEVVAKPADDFTLGYAVQEGVRAVASEVGQGFLGEQPVVRGTFTNELDEPVAFPRVVAVFYDEGGAVIGLTSCYAATGADHRLAAHASAPFETIFFVATGTGATRYVLYADASKVR